MMITADFAGVPVGVGLSYDSYRKFFEAQQTEAAPAASVIVGEADRRRPPPLSHRRASALFRRADTLPPHGLSRLRVSLARTGRAPLRAERHRQDDALCALEAALR